MLGKTGGPPVGTVAQVRETTAETGILCGAEFAGDTAMSQWYGYVLARCSNTQTNRDGKGDPRSPIVCGPCPHPVRDGGFGQTLRPKPPWHDHARSCTIDVLVETQTR